jgi:hypothetical protein
MATTDQPLTGRCGPMDTVDAQREFSQAPAPGMTLGRLIDEYQTHAASNYHKLRYHVRQNTKTTLRRLALTRGETPLTAIRAATVQIWYDEWATGGKVAMAHAFIAQIRTLFGFGLLMLEEKECERLCITMNKMRFRHVQPRTVWLTAEQADSICQAAREHFGWYSLALAQAFQFELMFRQKDICGEWVPENEPGESDVRHNGLKWLRGIRWEEIDDNMMLHHVTSKRQKAIDIDLRKAPMALRELEFVTYRPTTGPIIINDVTGLPWSSNEFRRKWRLVANHVGIPKEVRNQDSRAGAITEATEAGADIEHVRHAATHSDITQTQRYSRGAAKKIEAVQDKRLAHRYRNDG